MTTSSETWIGEAWISLMISDLSVSDLVLSPSEWYHVQQFLTSVIETSWMHLFLQHPRARTFEMCGLVLFVLYLFLTDLSPIARFDLLYLRRECKESRELLRLSSLAILSLLGSSRRSPRSRRFLFVELVALDDLEKYTKISKSVYKFIEVWLLASEDSINL